MYICIYIYIYIYEHVHTVKPVTGDDSQTQTSDSSYVWMELFVRPRMDLTSPPARLLRWLAEKLNGRLWLPAWLLGCQSADTHIMLFKIHTDERYIRARRVVIQPLFQASGGTQASTQASAQATARARRKRRMTNSMARCDAMRCYANETQGRRGKQLNAQRTKEH